MVVLSPPCDTLRGDQHCLSTEAVQIDESVASFQTHSNCNDRDADENCPTLSSSNELKVGQNVSIVPRIGPDDYLDEDGLRSEPASPQLDETLTASMTTTEEATEDNDLQDKGLNPELLKIVEGSSEQGQKNAYHHKFRVETSCADIKVDVLIDTDLKEPSTRYFNPAKRKTTICKHWHRGNCAMGISCNFIHPDTDEDHVDSSTLQNAKIAAIDQYEQFTHKRVDFQNMAELLYHSNQARLAEQEAMQYAYAMRRQHQAEMHLQQQQAILEMDFVQMSQRTLLWDYPDVYNDAPARSYPRAAHQLLMPPVRQASLFHRSASNESAQQWPTMSSDVSSLYPSMAPMGSEHRRLSHSSSTQKTMARHDSGAMSSIGYRQQLQPTEAKNGRSSASAMDPLQWNALRQQHLAEQDRTPSFSSDTDMLEFNQWLYNARATQAEPRQERPIRSQYTRRVNDLHRLLPPTNTSSTSYSPTRTSPPELWNPTMPEVASPSYPLSSSKPNLHPPSQGLSPPLQYPDPIITASTNHSTSPFNISNGAFWGNP